MTNNNNNKSDYQGPYQWTLPSLVTSFAKDFSSVDWKKKEQSKRVKVVVIGGGIAGASVAYHLARNPTFNPSEDLLLMEKNVIGGGTTWHAAGLVGRLRTSANMTLINKESAEIYKSLHQETGIDPNWVECGSIIVARTQERLEQIRRSAAMSALFGVEAEFIDDKERMKQLWPPLRTDDLLGAAYLPSDGKVVPQRTAEALAKGAADKGVRVFQNASVDEILQKDGKVIGVRVGEVVIECEKVVVACGMWSRVLAARSGVVCPLFPVEHHYLLSEPLEGIPNELPVGRDPDEQIYFRSEGSRILLGAFQNGTRPWKEDIPKDFSFKLLGADWEKYQQPLREGIWRIPVLQNAKWDLFLNGPESFTPDNNFICGEAPEVKGFFLLTGFNSVGIASAGGAGKVLAEWLVQGHPTLDLTAVDVRRFSSLMNVPRFLSERASEVLAIHYQMAWPNREFVTGRDLRRSPFHERLAAQGAVFGQKSGWERPLFFSSGGVNDIQYSFWRQNWFQCSAEEHQSTREKAALFDQTGFSKLMVSGKDALKTLQRVCGGNIDVEVGKVVYTGMFNWWKGGFESDLTVVRLNRTQFYLITGTSQGVRDADWIQRHIDSNQDATTVTDVTESYAVLGLMGPSSRLILQKVLSDSHQGLTNDTFPFGTAKKIHIGSHSVLAVRVTYVGELGWELHIPVSSALSVYDTLWAAGIEFGLRNAGHYAINSLRLEKGYRAFPADIGPDDTPLEAGLSFAVDWKKNPSFIGKEALEKKKEQILTKRLVTFSCDITPSTQEERAVTLWGGETVYRDGIAIGLTTSASFGHTIGKAVALAYLKRKDGGSVDKAWIEGANYEIAAGGKKWMATPTLLPLYDPLRQSILA